MIMMNWWPSWKNYSNEGPLVSGEAAWEPLESQCAVGQLPLPQVELFFYLLTVSSGLVLRLFCIAGLE